MVRCACCAIHAHLPLACAQCKASARLMHVPRTVSCSSPPPPPKPAMSAAAFALRDGRRVEIAPMRCIRWVSLFSGESLDPDAYELIPRRLLPEGVDVAYFAVTYFAMTLPDSFYEAVAGSMPEGSQGMADMVPIRDEPFFALDAAGRFTPITNGQAVGWLFQLYPSNMPTVARFVHIPAPMLPPGVQVAWFDAYTFYTSFPGWAQRDFAGAQTAPAPPARRRRVTAKAKAVAKAVARAKAAPRSTDTRPLMTEQ